MDMDTEAEAQVGRVIVIVEVEAIVVMTKLNSYRALSKVGSHPVGWGRKKRQVNLRDGDFLSGDGGRAQTRKRHDRDLNYLD